MPNSSPSDKKRRRRRRRLPKEANTENGHRAATPASSGGKSADSSAIRIRHREPAPAPKKSDTRVKFMENKATPKRIRSEAFVPQARLPEKNTAQESDLDFFDDPIASRPKPPVDNPMSQSDAEAMRVINESSPPQDDDRPKKNYPQVIASDPNIPFDETSTFPRLVPMGSTQPTTFVITGALTSIGRAPGNTISFKDRMMSKNHAQIIKESDGNYYIEDLHSKNGIYINNKRAYKHLLRNGDIVILGTRHFKYVVPGHDAATFNASAIQPVNKMLYLIIALLATTLFVLIVIVTYLLTRQ